MTQNRLSLDHAALDWDEETPVSRLWDDIYFNKGNGMDESRAVFLDAGGVRRLWHDKPHLTIGETGFGTGLNFLTLWRAWKDEKASARIFSSRPKSPPCCLPTWPAPLRLTRNWRHWFQSF